MKLMLFGMFLCRANADSTTSEASHDSLTPPAPPPPVPPVDTQSPQPHAGQECPHYQQDQQSSAPLAKCDASIAPTTAADRSRSPASPDRPARVDTPHSSPIDRDARCSAPHDAVELRAHESHVREPHHWIHPAAHPVAVRPAAIAALPRAGRYVRAAGRRSCCGNAGWRRDDSDIVPRDRRPSRTDREALPFCHLCGLPVSR